MAEQNFTAISNQLDVRISERKTCIELHAVRQTMQAMRRRQTEAIEFFDKHEINTLRTATQARIRILHTAYAYAGNIDSSLNRYEKKSAGSNRRLNDQIVEYAPST